jgi:peptidoglycan/LPS O-acetylase OafA/YrhL
VKEGRFTLVHALRGLAALWVVLFHVAAAGHISGLRSQLPPLTDHIFTAGHLGVAIFFALSGFVITHSVAGASITPSYLGRFALRRSIRLDPPYWASILFVVGVGYLSAGVKGEPFRLPSFPQTLAHLFYLQTLLGFPQINWVYWTLTYEIQFYLVLVLLIMAAQRMRIAPPLIVLLPFLTTMALWLGLMTPPTGLFVDLWHAFLAGVLAYWAKTSRLALYAFVGVCALSLALSPSDFTILSIGTAVVLHMAFRTGYIYRGLDWRWVQFLGTVSYSLYLIHNPIVGGVSFLTARWIGSDLVTLILSVAASIAAAAAFWYLLERPSLALAHRIRVKKTDKQPHSAMSDSHTAAPSPQNAIGELRNQPLDERRSR